MSAASSALRGHCRRGCVGQAGKSAAGGTERRALNCPAGPPAGPRTSRNGSAHALGNCAEALGIRQGQTERPCCRELTFRRKNRSPERRPPGFTGGDCVPGSVLCMVPAGSPSICPLRRLVSHPFYPISQAAFSHFENPPRGHPFPRSLHLLSKGGEPRGGHAMTLSVALSGLTMS